jgi:hypothetical protein
MRSDTNLYFVQSPLQVINAFEAKRSLSSEHPTRDLAVQFNTAGAYNNRLVANTLLHLGWEDVVCVPHTRNPWQKLRAWLRLLRAIRGLGPVRRAYIGAYDSGMMVAAANSCRHADVWIVDDGTASLLFPAYRYEGVRCRHQTAGVRLPLIGFDSRLPARVDVFSIYDLGLRPPDTLHKNRMSVLRKGISFDDEGPVFLVGSMIPEHGICGFEEYGFWLQRIREHFGSRPIHYFAHRRETMERKSAVTTRLGITVQAPELPFELALSSANQKPCAVASFYTTVFDTLVAADAVPAGRMFAFHIPPELILEPTERIMATKCYDTYACSGIVTVVKDWI